MRRRRTSVTKRGFTLVEVIISVSLGATLMVGLWTAFDIFSALQERAETQSAQAQLTRGLLHQLQDDLNRVHPPVVRTSPVPSENTLTPAVTQSATDSLGLMGANEATADQTVERIALLGSQTWLIMDLTQSSYGEDIDPAARIDPLTESSEFDFPSRRVIYHFVAPEFAILQDSLDSGLTRWELSNPPTKIRDLTEELDRGELGTPNSIVWQTTDAPTAIVAVDEQAPHTSSQARLGREQVPEIKRFLFRYYDGANWRTTWDSRRDGALPLAVECLLVWRDRNELGTVAPETKTLEPTEIREELAEISLSTAWDNLGQQDYSATSARLPKGFGRYVLCLPASLPPQRHLADTPMVSLGQR